MRCDAPQVPLYPQLLSIDVSHLGAGQHSATPGEPRRGVEGAMGTLGGFVAR